MKTRLLALVAVLGAALAGPALAVTPIILHSFTGGADGYNAQGALIEFDGALYGTTAQGGGSGCGGSGCGTVFRYDLGAHSFSTIYAFAGGEDGVGPNSALLAVGGKLYGTTHVGGDDAHGGAGSGVLFSIDPTTGAESVLHRFGSGEGQNPYGALVEVGGKLFGTTLDGGNSGCFVGYGCGTVFSYDLASGAESVVHAFTGADGSNPVTGMLELGGQLYGTTYRGGAGGGCVEGFGCGTLFRLNPTTGAYDLLHSFSAAGSDGASPDGGLLAFGGAILGTTNLNGTGGCPAPYGCGTVFSLNPGSGVLTPLHQFTGGADGLHPTDTLIDVGGQVYGTSSGDRLFRIDPITGHLEVIATVDGGAGALTAITGIGGLIYGIGAAGGAFGHGSIVVFSAGVPEPATWSLLLSGFFVLAAALRWRPTSIPQ